MADCGSTPIMMSQLVSTVHEPELPTAPILPSMPPTSSARLSGSGSNPTPRVTTTEQSSLQQQLKRLFTLTLSPSISSVADVDRSVNSPLLALPEAVLDAVVGFALRHEECNGLTVGVTTSETAAISANRAIDLRALRASCWTLRVLADRQIGSLEVCKGRRTGDQPRPLFLSDCSASHRTPFSACIPHLCSTKHLVLHWFRVWKSSDPAPRGRIRLGGGSLQV